MSDGPQGVVYVRDALIARDGVTAADLMRPIRSLPADTPKYAALSTLRESRNHLPWWRTGQGSTSAWLPAKTCWTGS